MTENIDKHKRGSDGEIIANRRGLDHKPNEPLDSPTDPIRRNQKSSDLDKEQKIKMAIKMEGSEEKESK